MKKLEVYGGYKLQGQVRISGSKNSSLPILAASILSDKRIFVAKFSSNIKYIFSINVSITATPLYFFCKSL